MDKEKDLDKNECCICDALTDIKKLQDLVIHFRTKYFGKLLAKIVGVDTIPFMLQTRDGQLKLMGHYTNKWTGKEDCFFTQFFRIEKIDKEECCAFLSLLLPLDLHGEPTDSLCDVMILKKTSTCVTVDLSCVCAVQPIDSDMLKRKIIIEPKW